MPSFFYAVMAANIWSMTEKSIVVFIIAKFLCSVRYASGHSLHVRVTLNFAGVNLFYTDFHRFSRREEAFRAFPCYSVFVHLSFTLERRCKSTAYFVHIKGHFVPKMSLLSPKCAFLQKRTKKATREGRFND